MCIRHRTGIEPHVHQVGFTAHDAAGSRQQEHLIDIRAVQVEFGFHGDVIAFDDAIDLLLRKHFLYGAGIHCVISFCYFSAQFSYTTDADFLCTILCAPDRKRHAPIAGTGKVPVLQVVQPLSKTTGARRLRFPVDGAVEFGHALFRRRSPDKPGIQRIVQHRLVGTPAMRVIVFVFFDFEGFVIFLQFQRDTQVGGLKRLIFLFVFGIIFGFYKVTSKIGHLSDKAALTVHQRLDNTFIIFDTDHWNARFFAGAHVIRTKIRRGMNDSGTIFGGYPIAGNDFKTVFFQGWRRHVWQ